MTQTSKQIQEQCAQQIYQLLVHRAYRSGPLPSPTARQKLVALICAQVAKANAVPLFLFWGGAKNPNLPLQEADLCEAATLQRLQTLHAAVQSIYPPGLHFYIFPGDERVHRVNGIPRALTQRYVQGLTHMAQQAGDYFEVIPVSRLYKRYAPAFEQALEDAQHTVAPLLSEHPLYAKLVTHAERNLSLTHPTIHRPEEALKAAHNYIVYRLAEEKAGIFRDYAPCIRGSFVKFSLFLSFYAPYLDLSSIQPPLDCVLHFYTGAKGNITQPWQALGEKQQDRVLFLSQRRLSQKAGAPLDHNKHLQQSL